MDGVQRQGALGLDRADVDDGAATLQPYRAYRGNVFSLIRMHASAARDRGANARPGGHDVNGRVPARCHSAQSGGRGRSRLVGGSSPPELGRDVFENAFYDVRVVLDTQRVR